MIVLRLRPADRDGVVGVAEENPVLSRLPKVFINKTISIQISSLHSLQSEVIYRRL